MRESGRAQGRGVVAPQAPVYRFKRPEGERAFMAAYERLLARWPVPYDARFVATGFGATHVLVSGPEDAPPVVLLHGGLSTTTLWRHSVVALSGAYRTHLVDIVGLPNRSSDARWPRTRPQAAAWLRDVLDGLALARPHLAGVSFGGWLAFNFALAVPDRVQSLVVLTGGGLARGNWGAGVRFLRLLALPSRAGVERFWRWLVAADRWVDDELVELSYLAVRHFRPSVRFVRPTRFSDEELRGLRVPLLLLEGERLPMYDAHESVRRARRLIPWVQAELVADAGELYGHALAHVTPRILDFLAKRCRDLPPGRLGADGALMTAGPAPKGEPQARTDDPGGRPVGEGLESPAGRDPVPQVFDRKGCPLAYWLHGPESAPLVTLTHGGGVDHRVWRYQVPFLVGHGWRVLTWDLRGHGRSRPMGAPFSVPEAGDDLLAILDRVGGRTAVHVGLSVGGFVAQWLARSHPERVQGIVVIGAGPVTDAYPRWMWWALRAWPWFLRLLPWGLMRRLLVASSADRPITRAYLHEAFDRLGKRDMLAVVTGGLAVPPPDDPAYRIAQPCLIMHGQHDRFARMRAPAWAGREPNARYVVIPAAGHVAGLLDDPDIVNRTLLEFSEHLAGHDRGT